MMESNYRFEYTAASGKNVTGEMRMLALFVKVVTGLFFAFVAGDSFYKTVRIRRELEADLLNPMIAKTLRRRAIIAGIQFSFLTILAFASIWFGHTPLD